MTKKIIKLINNEKTETKIKSTKAYSAGSIDVCTEIDLAACYNLAYDKCEKDYAACINEAYDYCTESDHAGCYEEGAYDYCATDLSA